MTTKLFIDLAQTASAYREKLPHLPIGVSASPAELLAQVNTHLPDEGETAELALQTLIKSAENGLIHSGNSRYFGFVIGGATPVSVAADWLTSAWDQCAHVYNTSPAAALIEEVVARWLLDLLGLPAESSVGLVTGAQMANFTALSVARNTVLSQHSWDINADGLQGAPHINIICGECCHATIHSAIHLMGLGNRNILTVRADDQGRMDPQAFQETLSACDGPVIVCLQAGNVNTGAFDPFADLIPLAKARGAWVHIDGAFGLWANASPRLRGLLAGASQADSWATDAHKWLNVPYDSGVVIVRDPQNHLSLKTGRCAYAGPASLECRDGSQWTPENSRRARGFVLYAALRHLGRSGVRQLIENCADMAGSFARELGAQPHLRILNQVVLNQVLFRVEPPSLSDLDAFNTRLARRLQRNGVCWMGTTQWHGQTALRISVSNYATSPEDVRLSLASLLESIQQELAAS